MKFWKRLSRYSSRNSAVDCSPAGTKGQAYQAGPSDDVPPPYPGLMEAQPTAAVHRSPGPTTGDVDSPFTFLAQFDTVFLIDDSGSMDGASWHETLDALSAISPIVTEQDADGVDVYFLNHQNPHADNLLGGYANVTTSARVMAIFDGIRPSGGTPTGTRLNAILKSYLRELSRMMEERKKQESWIKPLNIITITDGAATDDVESVIVNAASQLDQMGAEPWQVGIQFFQVGRDGAATRYLQVLDDDLKQIHDMRDMVDTVPWNGDRGSTLTVEGIMEVTMGAINRRLDRQHNSDARLRR